MMKSPMYWSAGIYDFLMKHVCHPNGILNKEFELVASKIEPNKTVLDLACGTGRVIEFLPKCNYIGIDKNRNFLKNCKKNGGKIILADIFRLPLKPEFKVDYTLLLGLFHHINPHCEKLLKRCKKISREKVIVLDIYINFYNYLEAFKRKLARIVDGDGCNQEDCYGPLTLRRWKKICEEFKAQEVKLLKNKGIFLTVK